MEDGYIDRFALWLCRKDVADTFLLIGLGIAILVGLGAWVCYPN